MMELLYLLTEDCHRLSKHQAVVFTGDKFLSKFKTCTSRRLTLLRIQNILSMKYYQDYFDEFCYKVNRLYVGEFLFERLQFACALYNYKNFVDEN